MKITNFAKIIFFVVFSVTFSYFFTNAPDSIDFKKNGETTVETIPTQEGYIKFRGYKTWYKIVGKDEVPGKYPLICSHGGPGYPHDYLKPLEKIAATGRRVIFYDQLGCGNSDRPTDNSLWTIELFKDELATLLKELKIERYHLLGQSWGGMLALEHTLDHAKEMQGLILASTTASMPQWIEEAKRLRSELPKAMQDIINKYETNGTTNLQEYEEVVQKYSHLHICRLDPWPEEFNQYFPADRINETVYQKMWGPSEFTVTGTLQTWDIRNKLNKIHIPTLITSGRYDESTPLINKTLHEGIANSHWVVFEKSAHLSHIEEPELYIKVLSDFLNEVEKHQKDE